MNTGDLNKALKDLVNVITDQEIVQSDLNDDDGEIQWTWEIESVKMLTDKTLWDAESLFARYQTRYVRNYSS